MPTQILMPALSPTMEEGKLAKWHVKEGDIVKAGDILAEIETDKATMEFEATDEGRVGRLLVPEGAEGVKVNQPIAILLGEGESAPAAAPKPAPKPAAALAGPAAPPADANIPQTEHQYKYNLSTNIPQEDHSYTNIQLEDNLPKDYLQTDHRLFASPLARRIAGAGGVDIGSLRGSGPRGRIVKADVEAALKAGAPKKMIPAPAPASEGIPGIAPLPDARLFYKEGEYEAIPHDAMRKSIARRLTAAKALIPHYYLTVECDIGELMAARARLNERAPKGEGAYRLSVNDFVVKAAALALMRVPEVNANWTDTAILRHKHADVGVAVALDFGLITPIVFRAEEKGLAQISNEVKTLAERARARKLKPQEYEGGGFSISNLGMFGVKQFTAVINPPQAAILAVGAGEERAVARKGQVVAATMMTVTMSCDHRVIDGATGARFLQAFKSFVEEPAAMLL